MSFSTLYSDILPQISRINPITYGKTRNYIDGEVTRLSPYLARGVLSTRGIALNLLSRGFQLSEMEVLLKELAWRDYYQLVWKNKLDLNQDLRFPQQGVQHRALPEAVLKAQTGIESIDRAIQELYATGYMHNHLRMYVAMLACNVGGSHWLTPARWMYYHLYDADWASNALSWQWVAGSFSSKKYYANQENINRFTYSRQRSTFLDMDYDSLEQASVPTVLQNTLFPELKVELPVSTRPVINPDLPIYLYHFYNLDPNWGHELKANRILLLEPDFFAQFPISQQSMSFFLKLAQNIPNVQIVVDSFDQFEARFAPTPIHFKEHPSARHYRGIRHERDWLFPEITGYFPSFFKFWKAAEKHIESLVNAL